jgi:hypothetical protein
MKYDLILENWKKFLVEQEATTSTQGEQLSLGFKDLKEKPDLATQEKQKAEADSAAVSQQVVTLLKSLHDKKTKFGIDTTKLKSDINNQLALLEAKKKKKSGDRCTRIAKRKYDVWPSAYASGAVVKCRQGKIWKGISESATDEEIDYALLLEEVEETNIIDEAKKKDYKPNFSKEKEQGLHGWFARNKGKGWINCRTGGPCGRDSADSGGKYPACRPTKAQCKSAGKGPLRKKKSSKPISWTKKKKKD